MAITGVPSAATELNVADVGQKKATPFPGARQAGSAFPAKLVRQRFLFSLRVAEDYGAELAAVAVVHTDDLFLLCHRLLKQLIRRARPDPLRLLPPSDATHRASDAREQRVP